MRSNRSLIIGVALLFIGITGFNVIPGLHMSMGSMMNGRMMMDANGMKEMMQDMMGAQLPPSIDPGDLPEATSNGARLLGQYCTQCHEMPGPGMHTADEWPPVIERMNWRMQMMSGRGMMSMMHDVKAPSDDELDTLAIYLQKHAQRAINKTQYKDLDTPAGQAFEATCSQCHALPDPMQHTTDEWSGVVQRMKRNMSVMGKDVPNQKTLKTIVEWLQGHAREPRP